MTDKLRILAVDDERFNLDIIEMALEDKYEVARAQDGLAALEILERDPDFDVIVLDRSMPRMDGMELLRTLTANPRYRDIPIIMQTANGQPQQVLEGIQAGVYYYLIKPYDEELLLSLISSAVYDAKTNRKIREEISKYKNVSGLIEYSRFRFRTLEEAVSLAYYVANACPKPDKVVYGLNELMVNAIEHGNLKLSYIEKPQLLVENRWNEEVDRLLALPENLHKFATLVFELGEHDITITISDQGDGFNWKNYVDFDPVRMTEPHGRGIAMSKAICFSALEYREGGKEVVCRIMLE